MFEHKKNIRLKKINSIIMVQIENIKKQHDHDKSFK
jgi:hypothetical protein